jgi:predicted lipoprotein with Yx(FWY)xxD motif
MQTSRCAAAVHGVHGHLLVTFADNSKARSAATDNCAMAHETLFGPDHAEAYNKRALTKQLLEV